MEGEHGPEWKRLEINEDYAVLCRNLSLAIGFDRPTQTWS